MAAISIGICNAEKILKEKGYEKKNFPTNEFLVKVAEWFRANDIKSALYIYSQRFVERDDGKEFYIDRTDTDSWAKELDFSDFLVLQQKGLIKPHFLVDEPFAANAVWCLQTLGNFVVKKERKMKKTVYKVTLI